MRLKKVPEKDTADEDKKRQTCFTNVKKDIKKE